MDSVDKRNEKGLMKISVLNWIGTMVLCLIPGVNIIAMLAFLLFSKAQSKRSFAGAFLILTLFCAAIICAAFLIFPEQLSQLASTLRGSVPKATEPLLLN